jgi:hypothetical protein
MNATHAKEEMCPECGALLATEADDCWLCGGSRYPVAELVATGVAPSEYRTAPQFGLSTFMFAVTLLVVLFGVYHMAPGLGIGLTVLVIPPFLRTFIAATRRKAAGQPMSEGAKLGVFTRTLGIAIGIAICIVPVVMLAAVVAVFAICLAASGK